MSTEEKELFLKMVGEVLASPALTDFSMVTKTGLVLRVEKTR